MSNHFVITGRLGADIDLRYANGKAVANGRIVDQPRRLNPQTNQWEDAGEALWLGFSIWDAKAEALVEAAHKGDLVTVTGELVARSWDAQDGTKRTVTEIKAREVAVVPRATAKPRGQGEPTGWGQPQPTQTQQQPANPWNQDTGAGGWGGTVPAGTGPNDQPPF